MSYDEQSHFEIERKFSISREEYQMLPGKLTELSFVFKRQSSMCDTFLPTATRGDMSRIRVESTGDTTTAILTRKTWVTVNGVRERKETPDEIIGGNTKELLLELGTRLNGRELLSFHKVRDEYQKKDGDLNITVTLDNVADLGQYSGNYMEIEVLLLEGSDAGPARNQIENLAHTLLGDTRQPVELSYMEMLMRTAAPKEQKSL